MNGRETDFAVVYSSRDGLPVRLEAAQRTDARGREFTHHRLVTADGLPGAVVLAERGESLLLVRSRRDAAGLELWELPRGSGEQIDQKAEDPGLAAGVRELREETGLRAESARVLGEYMIDSSVYPQNVSVVRCSVSAEQAATEGDGEVCEARWYTRAEIVALIRSGVVRDAHSLSALALWLSSQDD